MSIRRLMAAAGGLVIVIAAGPVCPLNAQGTPSDLNLDSKFVRDVAVGNLTEIRLGQVAQKNAANQAVKDFGQRMVTDHTNLENQLTAMISKYGMHFQPGLDPQHDQEVNQLQKLSGAEFDRAYMTAMIQDHETTVNTFQTQGQAAHSAQMRDFVIAALPTVQQHLNMARQIGSQVGASNVAVTTPNGQATTPYGQVTTPYGQATTPYGQTTTPTGQTTSQSGAVVTPNAQSNQAVRADSKFIREVAADNMLEVQLGRLAEQKAQNSAVKQFGQKEDSDHNKLQSDWVGMASTNGLPVNPGMGRLHRDKVNRLQNLSGKDFDRAYMTMEVQNHKDYIDYFQKEGRSTQSFQARDLANRGLPLLLQHFTQAKQIGVQVGADTAATLRSMRVTKK